MWLLDAPALAPAATTGASVAGSLPPPHLPLPLACWLSCQFATTAVAAATHPLHLSAVAAPTTYSEASYNTVAPVYGSCRHHHCFHSAFIDITTAPVATTMAVTVVIYCHCWWPCQSLTLLPLLPLRDLSEWIFIFWIYFFLTIKHRITFNILLPSAAYLGHDVHNGLVKR